ncbi:unnamed protein product [Prunus armeniaca]
MKFTYNTLKEGWAMDDLITIAVLEENRTKAYGSVVNMAFSTLNEGTSTRLPHGRLGHISKERMKILVKEQVLSPLTFSDDEICIECVKGKLTKTKKKCATRSADLLEIIHTDLCEPFPHLPIDGNCISSLLLLTILVLVIYTS